VVGLIGTKMVTTASTYQTHLGLKGVQVLAPETEEVDELDRIIFQELLYGEIKPKSQQTVLNIIRHLADRGCEAIILASSEAPLVVTQAVSPLPLYDAADILARGAVRRAMSP
jgi:aspartate racemase